MESTSQHPLALTWCKYTAFQFHPTLSATLLGFSNRTAFPKRSIVSHLADVLVMESELLITPSPLRWAMVKMLFGIIKMWSPAKGAFTIGRANVTALSWEKIKKLLFFSNICPVLPRCVKGPYWHLLSIPLKESFTEVNLPAKKAGGFWRWHVESCHRSSRNLFGKSPKSWPRAYETTVLLKYKVITMNSLSVICIFNNFSSETCPVPAGLFASIHSWFLI